jgi:hypothetical protein
MAEWDIATSVGTIYCYSDYFPSFTVWNARSSRGYLIAVKFGQECAFCPIGQCVLFLTNRFKDNVLSIILPNFEEEWERQTDLGPAQATMPNLVMSARGKTKAGAPLLRTPRRCDRERGWKSVVKVSFDDGSTKRFTSRHRCHR